MDKLHVYIRKRFIGKLHKFENQGNRMNYTLTIRQRNCGGLHIKINIKHCTKTTYYEKSEIDYIINGDNRNRYHGADSYCLLVELGLNLRTRFRSMFNITPMIIYDLSDVERYQDPMWY